MGKSTHVLPHPLQPLVLALGSAVLLTLSFPTFKQPWCAWVALVPWVLALRGVTAHQAFWGSSLVGLVFFLGSIWWLVHVTLMGLVVLCAYLALYFGAFGWIVWQVQGLRAMGRARPAPLVVIPAIWVALEYLRSHFLSGFGWNLLGYSQTPLLPMIQLADLTGVWGVSYLIVMANVAIADWLMQRTRRTRLAVIVAAGFVAAAWGYGHHRLTQPEAAEVVKVAVVQGNIPQEDKWEEAFRDAILGRYEELTRGILPQAPQLIVWPETSVPGYVGIDEPLTARLLAFGQSVGVPLLIGAPMVVSQDGVWRVTNSAALLERDGTLVARYDKVHLVPFGEFVPGERWLPWLRDMLPPIGDFVPGEEYTVFQLEGQGAGDRGQGKSSTPSSLVPPARLVAHQPGRAHPSPPSFSVLICFEDIFPELARRFVQRGAQMLLTITNDAWFGKTAAAYQHAQASTFRAVELRVPMIRAANTGWSGCIDSRGRWLTSVQQPNGTELFVEGVASCEVSLGESETLYQRWGDWFAWICLGWSILGALVGSMRPRGS